MMSKCDCGGTLKVGQPSSKEQDNRLTVFCPSCGWTARLTFLEQLARAGR